MIEYSNKEALRILCKWLNDDIDGIKSNIDKLALATVLSHYIELAGHYDDYADQDFND